MIYLPVGRRELGKTTLALYLTRNVRPRIVFDPRALCPASNGRAINATDVATWFNTLHDSFRENDGGWKRAEITVTPDTDTQALFEFTCGEVKAWLQTGQPASFIVDESTFMDLDVDAFEWIIRQAPRKSVLLVLTQHRPVDVPPRIRAIVDVWCVFRTIEPRDLDVIAERCTKDFADKVSKLRPREFLSWDDTKPDNNVGVHLDPKVWHVPLAPSPFGNGVTADGGRGDLPLGNSTVEKKLALFDDAS